MSCFFLILGCASIAKLFIIKNAALCFIYTCLHKIHGCLFQCLWKVYFCTLRLKVLCDRGCLVVSIYKGSAMLSCSVGGGFVSAIASVFLYHSRIIWNCIYCCSLHTTSLWIWLLNLCFQSGSSEVYPSSPLFFC